jgi:uncharacterized membrane protein
MNATHLHLLLNHFPIVGAVLGVFLFGLALLRNSAELAKVAFGLFVLLGVIGGVVYITGGSAEEAVEHLPGFSSALLERHEDAALVATVLMGVAGVIAALLLVSFRRRAVPRWMLTAALLVAVSSVGVIGYAANLGGQIRHTEIRSGVATDVRGAGDAEERGERDHR